MIREVCFKLDEQLATDVPWSVLASSACDAPAEAFILAE